MHSSPLRHRERHAAVEVVGASASLLADEGARCASASPSQTGGRRSQTCPGSPCPRSEGELAARALERLHLDVPPRASGRRSGAAVVASMDQNCATSRPSGRAIAASSRGARVVEAVGLGDRARHAVLGLRGVPRRARAGCEGAAMITASTPPTPPRRRRSRCAAAAECVRTRSRAAPRPRGRAGPRRRSAGRSRPWPRSAARRAAATSSAEVPTARSTSTHHRHGGQRKENRPASASSVPRIQVRAQLGRGYCARKPGVPVTRHRSGGGHARSRGEPLRPDAGRHEHVRRRALGRRPRASSSCARRRDSERRERQH